MRINKKHKDPDPGGAVLNVDPDPLATKRCEFFKTIKKIGQNI